MDIKEALTFDGLKYFYTQYIKPLKTGAFATVVNNATTTVENTVLDGRMGKTLADKDANLQKQINTLNSSLTTIKTAAGIGCDITNGEHGSDVLHVTKDTIGRWIYYNANSGSINLPPGEVWGFGMQLGISNIFIILFLSGTTGKIYHAIYNNSGTQQWSPWNQH